MCCSMNGRARNTGESITRRCGPKAQTIHLTPRGSLTKKPRLVNKGRKMKTHQIKASEIAVYLVIACITLMSIGCAGDRYSRSTGTYIDDKTVNAKVKAELLNDAVVHGFDVKVDTFRGEVQLSGFVNSQAEKDRAAEIARNVPGVQAVRNNIVLKDRTAAAVGSPGVAVSGSSSAASGRVELDRNRTGEIDRDLLPARNIVIDASNGKATVRGIVDSQAEKASIEKKLREIPGINSVDNELQVRPR
jgi:hyperosmotically inducible periplasmic protein